MKVYNNLNANKNEIKQGVFEKLSSAPANPVQGQYYFNTTDKLLYIYDGSKWVGAAADIKTMSTQSTSLTCTLPDDL